ncbi:DUF5979 domain-containing protein [uncultured Corynebacterium sp.]|uniref:DUF5979 domain-containing protein n=1 Tax=uncultured Corynebacterium sp. TaxID=159447 RepID=UPI002612714C|nr:DUF5979 domain-containing protein [uncultured Corynebacterium sp.]
MKGKRVLSFELSPLRERGALQKISLAIMAIVALILGGAPAASAQGNSNVKISNPQLVAGNGKELSPDGKFYPWTVFDFSFDWEATNGTVNDGESFTVEIPAPLQAHKDEFPLVDENGNTGGLCTTGGGQLTCTFNEAFANKDQVKGHVTIGLQSTQTESYDGKTIGFTLNGITTAVQLPEDANGFVTEERPRESFGQSEKDGWVENAVDGDTRKVSWFLNLKSVDLPDSGALVIEDKLDGPHKFSNEEDETLGLSLNGFNGGGVAEYIDPLNAEVNLSEDGKSATITIPEPTGGWSSKENWQVHYYTYYEGEGSIPNGTSFGNTANVNGNGLEKTVKFTQTGSGTIQGVDRNSYALKKHIVEGSELVPEGTEFTVHVKIESSNEDFNDEYDQKVSANGEFVKGSKELPAGTKVTLTEPTFPDVEGVTFGDPKFRAGEEDVDNVEISEDGKTATLTVVEDRNVEVHLDNTAKKSTGAFEITKELVNPDNLPISEDAEFTVDLTWTDEEGAKLEGEEYPAQIKLKAGETKKFDNLPAGTKVKYEESTDSLPKVEGTTWNVKYPDGQEAVVTSEQVAEGKIQNRMVPSTDVTLTKKVTGPAAFKVDDDHVFQVEASWTDDEGNQQQRVVEVKKDGSVNLEGLPLNKEITLVERTEKVSASEDSENLKWTGINWTVDGPNDVVQDENDPNKAILTLKGKAGEPVQVDLENKTGGKGLIIIPLPIPLPPFGGSGTPPGSSVVPPAPGGSTPGGSTPGTETPGNEAPGSSIREDEPSKGSTDSSQGNEDSRGGLLAMTGANVGGVLIVALAMSLAGIALMILRRRKLS